ncbi:MFS transporter [Amycolatopsis sp. K13G38]|uniref:MFS transporter n=1 Tax=Amycolatopsis acididurans TaxID=2724524 RepID=A0ABX1IW20_9PSEU|nr:MFS transporter [Amycolatopsis acididurans]NKQ51509.1 MFS transporter [Amycolatopsis acididurans]
MTMRSEDLVSSTVPAPAGSGAFGNAGWTPRLVLSVISILCLVEAVAFAYVGTTTALPKIIEHFHTTQAGWLLTAYALVGAASAPLFGKLADLHGKRRMMLIAIGLAAAGDILAAVAPAFWMMVLGQVLHGCVSACLYLGYSLMRDTYPRRIVPFGASVSMTGAGILSVGAPFLIGVLIDNFGFRSVYVFDLAWLVVMAVIVMATTPETSLRRRARLDIAGSVLLAGGLTLVLLGISMGDEWGWSSAGVLGSLVGGLVVLAVYVVLALRIREPVLDLRVLVRRTILFGVLAGGVAYGLNPMNQTLLALLSMTPQQLGQTYGLGFSATKYALITGPMSLGSVLAGLAVGLLVRRTGARLMMYAGLLLFVAGALFLMTQHDTYGKVLTGAVILGVGTGFSLAAMPNLIIAGAPAEQQGSMSSAGELSAGLIGAITPIVAFAIMTPSAISPVPGVLIYSDSGITTSLLVSACIAAATLVAEVLFLRPRAETPLEAGELAPAPERATPA